MELKVKEGDQESMKDFKLEPADILVNVDRDKDPISLIKRWVLGSPYEHVFMYLGQLILARPVQTNMYREVPILFESNGRGVVIQSLSNRYGQEVVVLRLKFEQDSERIPWVLEEAIKLASDSQSYYDYLCIVRFVIPRLICEKLGIPLPLKYHRDPWHICSEAVFEVFINSGLELLYLEDVPLPGDFVNDSLLLEKIWSGKLSEGVL